MNRVKIIYIVVPLLMFSVKSIGQPISFRHIDSSDGLPHNTVLCITQDANGFMWFGTRFGLSRYDGNSFTSFNTKNSNLPSNTIRGIIQTNDSVLYIATEGGVVSFNQYSNIMVAALPGKISTMDIIKDGSDQIWIGSEGNGIYRIKGNIIKHYPFPAFVVDLFCTSDNQIYALSNHSDFAGLYQFDKKEDTFDKILPIKALSITEDNSNLWIGTEGKGLIEISNAGDVLAEYKLGEKPNRNIIRDIIPYEEGFLAATEGGLVTFDKKLGITHIYTYDITNPYGVVDNALYALYKDVEGGIWIGSYFRGLNYFIANNNKFITSTLNHEGIEHCGLAVSSFLEISPENIVITSEDNGLCYYKPEKYVFQSFPLSDRLSYNNVHDVCIDSSQRMWIGTYLYGINIYDPQKKSMIHISSDSHNIHSNSVYRIYRDSQNNMHIGTTMGASTFYADGTIIKHENTRSAIIRDIVEDRNGDIWFISMNKGLYKLNMISNKWFEYNEFNAKAPTNKTVCARIDNNGVLWVATEGSGLLRYDEDDSFSVVDEGDIPNTFIFSLECAGDDIWMGTTKGLFRYTPGSGEYRKYNELDGPLGSYYNYNASRKMSSGDLYFGTVNGFFRFNPLEIGINKHIPKGIITHLNVQGKEQKTFFSITDINRLNNREEPIKLKYFQNYLKIDIASLSFVNPSKNSYRYMLKGFDAEWHKGVAIKTVEYHNLAPGKYSFILHVSNNDGIWSQTPITLNFIIHQPFWFSFIAKIIYFILIISTIIAIFYFIKKREKVKHQRELDKHHKELNENKINFFTHITHEIKTPLSLIKTPIEIFKEDVSFPQHLRSELDIMDKNARWMEHLVYELLEFRQLEEKEFVLQKRRIDTVWLLQSIYERFLPYADRNNIKFDFFCRFTELPADLDTNAIIKVVSNLLVNAFKYARSHVVLSLRYRSSKKSLLISVYDDGNGIPDEQISEVFKPFTQLTPNEGKFKGVGIGLSMSKSLVELHNGKISISSYFGKWCKINVLLAQYDSNTTPDSPVSLLEKSEIDTIIALPDIHTTHKTEIILPTDETGDDLTGHILIVEDNLDLAQIVIDYLSYSFKVGYAGNGEEALKYIREKQPDLIISDIIMPVMDGIELTKEIRADYTISHTWIILLTAKTTQDNKIEGLEVGANAYINKPFSLSEVELTVRNLMESRNKFRDYIMKGLIGNEQIRLPDILSKDQQLLSDIDRLINENISNENFRTEDLANALNISKSLLYNKLKKLLDISPNQYIFSTRMAYSKRLLQETDLNISEISYMVGFSDPNYFSRSFKRFFNENPTQMRSKSQSG